MASLVSKRRVRSPRRACISEYDAERIACLLDSVRAANGKLLAKHLQRLAEKVEEAEVVPGAEMPSDVVTMNSEIRLVELDSGERVVVRLTYPSSANPSDNRFSILSPMGAELLGSRVGGTVEFESSGSARKYRIESIIYQPEAAEDYYR